ncbi:Putative motility protein [Modicisalibacter xianhensis]|uniref:Putative motility protein n=2 Tax=Modicisalibacter xianhensis TaxID=442341 RepID=A0A1I2Y3K3_9GAMM|nr:Putative motility protein [Halomonas xianhensis]
MVGSRLSNMSEVCQVDSSVNATVSMALTLQQYNAGQQAQMSLLKESLETQANQVSEIMESAAPKDSLASSGSVGTRINTYA